MTPIPMPEPGSRLLAASLPRLRQLKWASRRVLARAGTWFPIGKGRTPITFVVGCGRSGTTLLGTLLGRHRQITYFNEPLDIWNAVDARTDYLDFFGSKGLCHMDEEHVNDLNRVGGQQIFATLHLLFGRQTVVEKSPANSWRLRWLRQLFPQARFVHLVRNGPDVVSSITLLSNDRSYRVAGRPNMGKWWGVGDHKLKQLIREAPRLVGYHSQLEKLLANSADDYRHAAAHEWISANRDIEQSKDLLGLTDLDCMLVRYEDLIRDPVGTLKELNRWMGLADPGVEFYQSAERLVQLRNQRAADELALAGWIRDDFAATMRRYGYGRTEVVCGRQTCRHTLASADPFR